MTARPTAMVGLLLALAAAPALAQPPADPPVDPVDTLLRPEAPPSTLPPPLPVMPPPRGGQVGPLPLEQTGKTPDGPPTPADIAYDERLRASMAASQELRGALDGGWSVLAGDRELYILELADRKGWVEGAWRDPRRPGVSGFVDAVDRDADQVVLHFAAVVVTLRGREGRWAGDLREGDRVEAVTLWRRGR